MSSTVTEPQARKLAPKPSLEQKAVIESDAKCLSINAFAGSGKTFTLVNYAKARMKARKLYICFNKTAQTEAQERFIRAGVQGTMVQTAHSLAYQNFGRKVKLFNNNPKTADIMQSMNVKIDKKTYPTHRMGYMMFLKYLQSASRDKVEKYDFEADLIGNTSIDLGTLTYFHQNEGQIRDFAGKIWKNMNEGNMPLVHDFYLKWFHLHKPKLGFEYILFDEAQDANPAMLDIFLSQAGNKVMIGDEHQAIYGWRGAVNALSYENLKKHGFERLFLNNCYRFGPEIAGLAHKILNLKKIFNPNFEIPELVGMSNNIPTPTQQVVIGRTNSSLLELALENVSSKEIIPFHVEGGVKNFSFFSDGVSLYDIYSLYANKKSNIRSPFIAAFKDFQEFKGYVISTGDMEFSHLIQIIERFKGSIFFLMKKLQSSEVTKEEAHLIFTTCHKAKGLEYPSVKVMPDFLNTKKLIYRKVVLDKLLETYKLSSHDDVKRKIKLRWQNSLEGFYQEVNLLYVAVTRSMFHLNYDSEMTSLFSLHGIFKEIEDYQSSKKKNKQLSELGAEVLDIMTKMKMNVDVL